LVIPLYDKGVYSNYELKESWKSRLDQFSKQKYLNLETFRKNGDCMKTPVWFVQESETIYVQTMADCGKVKRIRNNQRVNVVPCKMDGTPVGPWVPANAREVPDAELSKKVNRLLDKKYGLMKKMFSLGSSRQSRKDTILEIRLIE
jgi:PPOX class probable F420-dependent enzyme